MRRRWFLALGLSAGLAVVGGRGQAAEHGLTIIEPYGPGSVTDRIADSLKPGLEQAAGQPVAVEHAGGAGAALARLAGAPPDGKTVLVIDLLSVEIADAVGAPAVKLSSLTPLAKLTGPGSVALVVAASSPIKSWADFAAAARAHPLTLAYPGRTSAVGVPVALIERALGVHFTDIAASDRPAILAALAEHRADAGFLITNTLLANPQAPPPPVRPIVTFGAARNPKLAQVPTFQESIGPQPAGKRHNSITSAIALFGPGKLAPAVVKRLGGDVAAAGRAVTPNPAGPRVEVGDAALLRETMARDGRVIKEVVDLLH